MQYSAAKMGWYAFRGQDSEDSLIIWNVGKDRKIIRNKKQDDKMRQNNTKLLTLLLHKSKIKEKKKGR